VGDNYGGVSTGRSMWPEGPKHGRVLGEEATSPLPLGLVNVEWGSIYPPISRLQRLWL